MIVLFFDEPYYEQKKRVIEEEKMKKAIDYFFVFLETLCVYKNFRLERKDHKNFFGRVGFDTLHMIKKSFKLILNFSKEKRVRFE